LEASPGRFVAVGLQVDVGSLSALVVNLRGDVVAERVVDADLRGSSPRRVLGRLSRMRDRLLSTLPASTVLGTGLALPGLVSSASRTLLRAPNLGWADVVVPDLMDAGPGAALLVGNEADLASTTVSFERPGRPSALADFVYLSGEVGIGGAVVLGGRPLGGSHGWAGEVGHVTVDPRGPRCACGSTGCLELYAGRRALLAAAGLPDDATPADLLARAREGDRTAQRAVDRAGRALGTALAVVVNVVDVPDVVLGGHLRDLTPLVGPVVERTLGERVLSAGWAAPTVRAAEPHRAPGALGAAYRVLQRLVDDPAAWLGVASGAAQGRT
jgi:predicted NBD/HSP70 family sugar kinase